MFEFATFFLFYQAQAQLSLDAAIAEANRTDPGWRYEDIQARRPKLADKENGALQVLAVAKALPKNWQPFVKTLKFPNERKIPEDERLRLIDQFEERLSEGSPPAVLNEQESAAIAAEVKLLARSLQEAQKLRKFTHGRYPLRESDADSFKALQSARELARLLQLEAQDHAHHNRLGAALQSCQNIVHAGRLVGEEPDAIALLVRIALVSIAEDMMERVLARGETSEAILHLVQKQLAREEASFSPVQAARFQRAYFHRAFANVRAGKKPLKEFVESFRNPKLDVPTEADFLKATYVSGLERTWAAVLRQNTQVVENLKAPEERLPAILHDLEKLPKTRWLGAEFRSYMPKVGTATLRGRMILRTAQAALAVERYRLDKGKWPATLDDLVPAYLPRVPLDFYAGKAPLRLAKFGAGVVVYSVGPDGRDNGGKLRRHPGDENPGNYFDGLDIGFRLWEVNARRQPPGPPVLIPDTKKPPH